MAQTRLHCNVHNKFKIPSFREVALSAARLTTRYKERSREMEILNSEPGVMLLIAAGCRMTYS